MRVEQLDHVVLTVADIQATTAFYTRVLGLTHVATGDRHALRFGRQKINLHEAGHEFEPKAHEPTPGSADLCFVVAAPLAEAAAHIAACRIPVEVGPVARTGALGPMQSLYIRDPDRNLIEIAVYETGHAEESTPA